MLATSKGASNNQQQQRAATAKKDEQRPQQPFKATRIDLSAAQRKSILRQRQQQSRLSFEPVAIPSQTPILKPTTTAPTTKGTPNTSQRATLGAGSERGAEQQAAKINYWHYKQTGIKSRPIRLLKHPIEHIEMKIIFTYLLGFIFKLIAILTGPLIVLLVYLTTVPFKLFRRSTWFLLNLPFTFDARIKTTTSEGDRSEFIRGLKKKQGVRRRKKSEADDCGREQEDGEQIETKNKNSNDNSNWSWNYCPLSYLETYWFKEKLVNTVILVISNEKSRRKENEELSIDRLRCLVAEKILSNRFYRKFLSRVVARGIPFYKSYYWHYLGLAAEESSLGTEVFGKKVDKSGNKKKKEKESDDGSRQIKRKRRKLDSGATTNQLKDSSSLKRSQSSAAQQEGRQSSSSSSSSLSSSSFLSNEVAVEDQTGRNKSTSNSSLTSSKQFSVTSIEAAQTPFPPPTATTRASGKQAQCQPASATGKREKAQLSTANANPTNSGSRPPNSGQVMAASEQPFYLSDHIYIDDSLMGLEQVSWAEIRRHSYNLLELSLDMERPLWELRLIRMPPAQPQQGSKSYLIFRCHQSLADGRSLIKILTDHLTVDPNFEGKEGRGKDDEDCCRTDLDNGDEEDPKEGPNGAEDWSRGEEIEEEEEKEGERQEDEEEEEEEDEDEEEFELEPIKEKRSFVERVSRANSLRSAIFVGPLTVLLWVIWTFTRRKNNHLNRSTTTNIIRQQEQPESMLTASSSFPSKPEAAARAPFNYDERRLYMSNYDLTKFYQIKQMTRSTVSDVILCALSGALRDYLRNFNGVSNPPDLSVSLAVDMRQPEQEAASGEQHQLDRFGLERAASSSQQQHLHQSSSCCSRDCSSGNEPGDNPARPPRELAQERESKQPEEEEPQVNCTLVNVPLPTSVEGTVPRLWELRNTMDELRTSADPWVMIGLQRFLFALLPSSWYQNVINYIALRNSSTFVSNIRGPNCLVESWCVDLLQRAIFEAQQPPRVFRPQSIGAKSSARQENLGIVDHNNGCQQQAQHDDHKQVADHDDACNCYHRDAKRAKQLLRAKRARAARLKLANQLGGAISAVYYCMQPPTSEIPISFNCITYHNKLFVTSLSRSLLVEDSKLLLKLFFRQLDQLANTIAKRKSLVTMIRKPIPIEISCQLASPVSAPGRNGSEVECYFNGEEHNDDADDGGDNDDAPQNAFRSAMIKAESDKRVKDNEEEIVSGGDGVVVVDFGLVGSSASLNSASTRRPSVSGAISFKHKDDIEANLGQVSKCQSCGQTICTCSRRRSLFSFDYGKQRAVNLLSLLHPANGASSSSRSLEPAGQAKNSRGGNKISGHNDGMSNKCMSQPECVCGQQLLREMDEESPVCDTRSGEDLLEEEQENSKQSDSATENRNRSAATAAPAQRTRKRKRPFCLKCRLIASKRSTQSLDASLSEEKGDDRKGWPALDSNEETASRQHNISPDGSNLSFECGRSTSAKGRALNQSAQLIVPHHEAGKRFVGSKQKPHSRSETDLLPSSMADDAMDGGRDEERSQRGLTKDQNWKPIRCRRGKRKLSLFSKPIGVATNQHVQSRGSPANSNNSIAPSRGQITRMFKTPPVELASTRQHLNLPSKRRQSVATSTGSSHIQRTVIVKDEINADVGLRYQLDGPFLGIRNRRFSTIGNAVVGGQRRASLIPFGLMHNQSLPKLFWVDNEAYL